MNSESDDSIPEVELIQNINFGMVKEEVIAQGGGEGPADVSTLAVSLFFYWAFWGSSPFNAHLLSSMRCRSSLKSSIGQYSFLASVLPFKLIPGN